MKKALTIILIYFLTCVLGTAVCATLFMFNADMMTYVTDVPSSLFSLNYFLYGMSASFPLMGIASLVAVVLIMVRNKSNQLPCIVTYGLLGALTWLVLIPFSLRQLTDYEKNEKSPQLKTSSAGVFREDASGVFYYSRILENGNTDGIFIDTTGYLGKEGSIITFYDSPVNNSSAYPYSDILIKDAVQPSKMVVYPLSVYASLLTSALHYNESGFLAWMCFASLGLALLSIYGLQFFSEWKLCSAFATLTVAAFIVFVNYFCYMDMLPSFMRQFSSFLSDFTSAENALVVVLNLCMSAVLVLYGIGMGLYRSRKVSVSVTGED